MGKLVCVTGASGFIASWIIKILLERGYTVRGTYRQPGYDLKTKHLRALEGAEERLTFVEADLLVEGSFDAAVAGCDCVFHTASPCYRRVKDPQAELIDPAVKGTLNVLGSCTKEKTVKKVVLTSSLATVRYTGRSLTPDVVVDETWWSDQDHCRQKEMWNALSKILAEDAAWDFLKEKHMDMVTINPGTVIGPFLQATPNSSSVVIRYLLRGMETYPNATLCLVNVKDVAMAHILAFENPCASGRYCMGESVVHFSEVVEIMHDLYPDLKLPTKCENDKPFEPKYQISKAKVTTLGIEYIPLKESIKGTVVSLEKFEQWMMAEKRRDEELLKRKEVVCVTGASGFIASWIIKLLLERGYTVRGTYRKPDVYLKTKHLYELQGAEERFTLVEADLLVEGSFDAAVAGCDCVFHTASPFHHSVTDPQAELIDPAVKGTLNVLGSCAKEQTVKRVVLTSSFAAVGYNGRPLTPNVVVDETWWSDPDHCRRKKMWNSVSKTLAEDAAWKFVKEKHMDMVTINPGLVIGRFLQTTPNGSSDIISNLMKCTEICPNTTMGWVNVKDVAMAHILAFENPQASGRYCVVESVAHYSKVVEILLELCPDLKLPTKIKDGEAFVPTYQISKERTRTLGIEYIPLKESIKGTVESLKKFEQWTMAEKRRDDELKIWLEGEDMNLLWSADALACATVLGTRNL